MPYVSSFTLVCGLSGLLILIVAPNVPMGIDGIMSNAHQRRATFDLHGRRVSKAGKGLYIVSGKKVLVK